MPSIVNYCTNCGEQMAEDADLCPECGVDQPATPEGEHMTRDENQKYCTECGELINRQAEICPECGVRQPGMADPSTDKVVSGVFALLLGGIGVHKFYQGNIKYGVLYLCFFWTGVPAIVGLIEGILMLLADDAEYEQTYADGSILGQF